MCMPGEYAARLDVGTERFAAVHLFSYRDLASRGQNLPLVRRWEVPAQGESVIKIRHTQHATLLMGIKLQDYDRENMGADSTITLSRK